MRLRSSNAERAAKRDLAQPLALLLLPLPWLVQRFMAARSVGGRALVLMPHRQAADVLARHAPPAGEAAALKRLIPGPDEAEDEAEPAAAPA